MAEAGGNKEFELLVPPSLRTVYKRSWQTVDDLLYRPATTADGRARPPSLEWALAAMEGGAHIAPANLVPVLPVDDESFACLVCATPEEPTLAGVGSVVRWHLGEIDLSHQGALLDTDVLLYVESVEEELAARPEGLRRVTEEIGPAYEEGYLKAQKRPRDFVVRPVRLACQNVVVGLGAFAQDAAIDGMTVPAWQTCEVPHVATHDANRALAALMLCDTFQSGGTMEIRFDRPVSVRIPAPDGISGCITRRYHGHPEGRVPASLRRYGRTVGVELGAQHPGSIFPAEARALFQAVTPMPNELAARVEQATTLGLASPERLCFTLLSQIWREIELDFLLATSDRIDTLLEGGSEWSSRIARQAESHLARAALMLGMYFRRLDTRDAATATTDVRVLEDNRVGVSWSVVGDVGAVLLHGVEEGALPWHDPRSATPSACEGREIVILPRPHPTVDDFELAADLSQRHGAAAIVVPADADLDQIPAVESTVVLRCPDRLGELDQAIEVKMLTSRLARA